MNLRERFLASCLNEPTDRLINTEFFFWDETIQRWHQEGLPSELIYQPDAVSHRDPLIKQLGLDCNWLSQKFPVGMFEPDPLFEQVTLAEDADTRTLIDKRGITIQISRNMASIPHYLDFPVKTRDDFEKVKWRYRSDTPERYPADWDRLAQTEYRHRDYPMGLQMHGFYGQLREWMGFENLSLAFYDQPELISEMTAFWGDFLIATCQRALETVTVDYVRFWEDMSYNAGMMCSPDIFRKFFTPHYGRVVEEFKSRGIRILQVDSDGNVRDLIRVLKEVGINGMHPFERAAGNDLLALREEHPDFLMIGGVDKRVIAKGKAAIRTEMEFISRLAQQGNFIPHFDHGVPPDISFENFRYYNELKLRVLEQAARHPNQ